MMIETARKKLTPKEQACVSRKIRFLVKKERKPIDQATAIAYQHCAPAKARSKKSDQMAERVIERTLWLQVPEGVYPHAAGELQIRKPRGKDPMGDFAHISFKDRDTGRVYDWQLYMHKGKPTADTGTLFGKCAADRARLELAERILSDPQMQHKAGIVRVPAKLANKWFYVHAVGAPMPKNDAVEMLAEHLSREGEQVFLSLPECPRCGSIMFPNRRSSSTKFEPCPQKVAARWIWAAFMGTLWTRLKAAWPRLNAALKKPETAEEFEIVKRVVGEFGEWPVKIAKLLERAQLLEVGSSAPMERTYNQILALGSINTETEIKNAKTLSESFLKAMTKIKDAGWTVYDYTRKFLGPR